MTRILIGIGLLALVSTPAIAADGFRAKVEQWKKEAWGGVATVRIENRTRQPNLTWLRIDCTAKKGLRRVIAQDFAFYKATIQPRRQATVRVPINLSGGTADRAECEVFLTDKTEQSEYERRLR